MSGALQTVRECETQRRPPNGRVIGKWRCPRCEFPVDWMIRPMEQHGQLFSLDRKLFRKLIAESIYEHMQGHRKD